MLKSREYVFRFFIIIFTWKRAWQTGGFVPSLVEIGPVVLEKKIFKIPLLYFHYFVNISPWKRGWSFIWTNWTPFTQECFVPILVEIGPVVLEKKMEMWNVYRWTDRGTNDGLWAIREFYLSFSSGDLNTISYINLDKIVPLLSCPKMRNPGITM